MHACNPNTWESKVSKKNPKFNSQKSIKTFQAKGITQHELLFALANGLFVPSTHIGQLTVTYDSSSGGICRPLLAPTGTCTHVPIFLHKHTGIHIIRKKSSGKKKVTRKWAKDINRHLTKRYTGGTQAQEVLASAMQVNTQ